MESTNEVRKEIIFYLALAVFPLVFIIILPILFYRAFLLGIDGIIEFAIVSLVINIVLLSYIMIGFFSIYLNKIKNE